jgi:hypothetical protein
MSEFNIMDYAPIAVMFLVAAGFGASQLIVTQLIGPRKRTATKLMPYECGKDPVGNARDKFSVKFYTVAVIFIMPLVGKLVAKLFHREPKIQARRDLRRFKQFMETGEIATSRMNADASASLRKIQCEH